MKKYAIEPFNPSAKIQALTGFGHSNGEDEEGNEDNEEDGVEEEEDG